MSEQPRVVGRYLVHQRIAAGGMATVHVGRLMGLAGFSRTVAIKRLHDQYGRDPDFVAMLLDEARLAATIRHPNVVPTLDVVAEGDELLVVMEYVEGDSVAHIARLLEGKSERIPPAFAASIVAQALHGLHAAHEAKDNHGVPLGIVHRDVSPQNILVGVDGVARVLDFGIAKAASRATATEDGQIKGKTAYMAPEQLQHASVDRRTDIFAAGVVLWELLCAKRLFFADSPSETIGRVLAMAIEPPHRVVAGLPEALSRVVARGLERDPDKRFQTAEDMANAIEDAVAFPRPKELGGWVASTAQKTLAARAELVKIVESSSHKMPAAVSSNTSLARAIEEADRRRVAGEMPTNMGADATPPPLVPPSSVGVPNSTAVMPAPPTSRPVIEDGTGLSTVRTSHGSIRPAPAPSRTWLVVLAAVLGTLVVVGLAFGLVVAPRLSGPRPALSATNVPSPPASSVPVAESATAPPPSATASTAPTASVATATPSATTKPKTGPTARPTAKPDCRIPFTVDAKGNKHFKEECLN